MEYRLGDIIDDYCVKCKRIMNHAIVSVVNELPAKVRCRTCYGDHDYRHELAPPPKIDPRKAAALLAAQEAKDALAKAAGADGSVAPEAVVPELEAEEKPKSRAKARGK